MDKSNYFSSKSVFGQLISLIDDSLIRKEVEKYDSARSTKLFTTKDHLISMLFCSFSTVHRFEKYPVSCLVYKAKRIVFS